MLANLANVQRPRVNTSDAIASYMLYHQSKNRWAYHALRTLTLEELSAKTADLSSRIDAAKAKHGVM